MTPLMALDELCKVMSDLFDGLVMLDSEKFKVYSQNLPPKVAGELNEPYPYCLVTLAEGNQTDDDASQEFVIMLGTKEDLLLQKDQPYKTSTYSGYRDIANAIEQIRQRFSANPEYGNCFTVQPNLKWVIQSGDEDYPFYVGGIHLTVDLPKSSIISQNI